MTFPAKLPNPYEERISRLERLARNGEFETARIGLGENYTNFGISGQLNLFGKAKRLLTFRPEINQGQLLPPKGDGL